MFRCVREKFPAYWGIGCWRIPISTLPCIRVMGAAGLPINTCSLAVKAALMHGESGVGTCMEMIPNCVVMLADTIAKPTALYA